MNRQEKAAVVQSLKDNFAQSKASFVVKYPGLSVEQMQKLRSNLREHNASFKVAKARLMKLAAAENESAQIMEPYYKDQIGLVFAYEEAAPVAKVLNEFAKENQTLSIVAGSLEQSLLEQEDVEKIATLPPKDVLLAQLCSTLQAPISGVARACGMMHRKLLWALNEVKEKKQ